MKFRDKRIVWCERIQEMKWRWNNHNIQHIQIIDLNRSVRRSVKWAWYVESSLFKFFRWVCEQCHLFFSASCDVSKCKILFIICYRRMNLAFILITLIINLIIVSEVYMLLLLHRS